MVKGTHGKKEQKFSDLDFNGQSRTLNSTLLLLEKEIRIHISESKNRKKLSKNA